MEAQRNHLRDISITRIAALYVICLLAGGLAVLNVFLHSGSVPVIAVCIAIAAAAVAGFVYCTRQFLRNLSVSS